jgi:hypothetical protein
MKSHTALLSLRVPSNRYKQPYFTYRSQLIHNRFRTTALHEYNPAQDLFSVRSVATTAQKHKHTQRHIVIPQHKLSRSKLAPQSATWPTQ